MTTANTKRRPFLILGVLCFILGLVLGILLGVYAINKGGGGVNDGGGYYDKKEDESISKKLIDTMDPQRIRENLRYFSSEPHVAGTPVSKEQAEWVREQWLQQGLDKAEIVQYEVLLSYPSDVPGEENRVQLLAGDGSVEFESQLKEKPLDAASNRSGMLPPYTAYSAAGEVEGEILYVNYGRTEDFEFLIGAGHTVKDTIVIARFGKIFRGDKVRNAAALGAKGLILYTDPVDYTVDGEGVYPDGLYLPGTGAQRGSALYDFGDPLTPGYPAVASAYRIPEQNLTTLPTIPVHPIGYDDAKELLKGMAGPDVNDEWKGGIEGITYRYGPGYAAPNQDKRVKMRIFTHNQMAWGWNVIGTIRGEIEPDRYVLMGNHRDAWGYGAIDASSGTSAMMEISRSFGKMLKQGWRPRRTVMFCSWGAEEFGLIGSNEWVEEFSKNLGERAVAYFNLDVAVHGNHVVSIAATPGLNNAVYAAAKKIADPSPSGNRQTVYDTWVERGSANDSKVPVIGTLGSGSDYAAFVHLIGVSAMDFSYSHDKVKIPISPYPLYHSVYETFYAVDTYLDPDYKYHLATAQLFGELLRDFSDSVVLPIDCIKYANEVQGYVKEFKEGDNGVRMLQGSISLDGLESAANNFTNAAASLGRRLADIDVNNALEVRQLNDKMMKLERAFIDPLGLPGRPFIRHVLFAPSSKNIYASDKFSGLADTLFNIDTNPDVNKWENVKQQLAAVTFAVQSAASVLMDAA